MAMASLSTAASPARRASMDCRRSMDLTAPVLARRCAAQRTSRLVPLNAAAEGTTSSSQQAFESVDQVATQQPSKAQGGACPFDTNYWHYSRSWPWWQQRAFLVPAGIAFIVAANMMEEPGIKTTLMASIPVALLWYLGLVLVPRQFSTYCSTWAKEHPEQAPESRK
ncbi:hypothetical protein CHLRE_10g419650v5 [Chlamydomonas reinhardtii]|uniref:Uncharacterized protein n=1 Tax=Chlamydomonas reinhardtii TaxID=3055 RepID=A8ICY1_CHLRE|nr:uncharacterized protein CHLRE_10g419650v5 [Chlamydomonas reinhardtii]PNW77037.1 hypothetical protein CHLRE_10g419650v5 [Chlamydomonas reinhardtii]|eukprot:XP_001702788.1 predicted protein [Chlamydomonas reinhardtii]